MSQLSVSSVVQQMCEVFKLAIITTKLAVCDGKLCVRQSWQWKKLRQKAAGFIKYSTEIDTYVSAGSVLAISSVVAEFCTFRDKSPVR